MVIIAIVVFTLSWRSTFLLYLFRVPRRLPQSSRNVGRSVWFVWPPLTEQHWARLSKGFQMLGAARWNIVFVDRGLTCILSYRPSSILFYLIQPLGYFCSAIIYGRPFFCSYIKWVAFGRFLKSMLNIKAVEDWDKIHMSSIQELLPTDGLNLIPTLKTCVSFLSAKKEE